MDIIQVITRELNVEKWQVEAAVKLTKEPKDYSLGEILRLTEGDLASVPCTSKTHEHCNHMESCPSHPIWQQLDNLINNYLDSVTLANLLNNE